MRRKNIFDINNRPFSEEIKKEQGIVIVSYPAIENGKLRKKFVIKHSSDMNTALNNLENQATSLYTNSGLLTGIMSGYAALEDYKFTAGLSKHEIKAVIEILEKEYKAEEYTIADCGLKVIDEHLKAIRKIIEDYIKTRSEENVEENERIE